MKWFIGELVRQGIAPVCGAKLPNGPSGNRSQCQADGRLTFASADGSQLHGNHEPELQDWERSQPTFVMDARRVELLCAECHNAWTAKQKTTGGLVNV